MENQNPIKKIPPSSSTHKMSKTRIAREGGLRSAQTKLRKQIGE